MAEWVRFKADVSPGATVKMSHTVMHSAGRTLQEVITRLYPGSATLLDVDMYIIRAGTLIREGIILDATGSTAVLDGENDTFIEDRLGLDLLLGDEIHVDATNHDAHAILPVNVRMRLEAPGRRGGGAP